MQQSGSDYPDIYFPLPNQLLREQTNINDGNTLRALPQLKTAAGSSYKSVTPSIETHNTPVCRHFMHWLRDDILPQSAFPAIENGQPKDEIDRIKAVMYYVLWHENQDRARQLGKPPAVLLENPGITYDEIKKHGANFSHVEFARKRGKLALHHELVTGIRGSRLWPWNDQHFKDADGKTKPVLSDFHFNLADLSMMSMFINGITQNPGSVNDPRNHLVVFVSNDTEFMREISEFSYGYRMVKPSVNGSSYRQFVKDYNTLSAEIEQVQQSIRHSTNGNEEAINEIKMLKATRQTLREDFEAPLKAGGSLRERKAAQVVPLLDEEYNRYEARGLTLAKPPPYAERPDILVLSSARFVEAMQQHADEMAKALRGKSTGASELTEAKQAVRNLQTQIKMLRQSLGTQKMRNHTVPDSMFCLQKSLRQHVENGRGDDSSRGR